MYLDQSHLEKLGISHDQLLKFMETIEQDDNVHIKTMMLYQDKPVFAYAKKPYDMKDKQLLFSITKSFAALGIGIALDQRLVQLDDCMIRYFEDKLPEVQSEHLKAITIKDLLTMSSGIHDNTYDEIFESEDWEKAFLKQPLPHVPGTYFRYSTHGSHMLSAIVQKVTGQTLETYIDQNLFKPMDIDEYAWEQTKDGKTAGGMGLSLSTENLCKVMMMLLNKGLYNNKRILSEAFIEQAIYPHIFKTTEKDIHNKTYSGKEYGFQIHVGKDGCYRFDGHAGQLCLAVPNSNYVIAITSQNSNLERLLKHVHDLIIEPKNHNTSVSAEVLEACILKQSYLSEVHNKYLLDFEVSFHIKGHFNNLNDIVITQCEHKVFVRSNYFDFETEIYFDLNQIVSGKSYFEKDLQWCEQPYVSEAYYQDQQTLVLKVYHIETPCVEVYTFNTDENELKYDINKSFSLENFKIKVSVVK